MQLFGDFQRIDEKRKSNVEPDYVYLNRSTLLEGKKIRDTLENWFDRYPTLEKLEFLGRFRSTTNEHHFSAFFELLIHEFLLRHGCSIVAHPTLPGTDNKPDFQAVNASGTSFLLECVLATEESEEQKANNARINVVYDLLNEFDSPDFFLLLKNVEGAPKSPPSVKKIKSFLNKKLSTITHDEIVKLAGEDGLGTVPQWHYEHDGWKLTFTPLAKSEKTRGKSGVHTLGCIFKEGRWIQTDEAIRKAVLKKAGKYGNPELPYIVAVNIIGEVDSFDVLDALLGNECVNVKVDSQSEILSHIPSRIMNGVWTSKSGPRNTRISAILIAFNAVPLKLHISDFHLYLNPWAKTPIAYEIFKLPKYVPEDDKLILVPGTPMSELLNWPKMFE